MNAQDALNLKVKNIAKKKSNATCFFSGEVNANYSVISDSIPLGCFCCDKVVNQLRELCLPGLKVKGVSMANFSEKELEILEVGFAHFLL
jgi:hypothetical protein